MPAPPRKTVFYCEQLSEVPNVPHYAILKQRSYSSEEYNQKCTNHYLAYEGYLEKEEWEREIERLTLSPTYVLGFKAFQVNPAKITVSTKIEIK